MLATEDLQEVERGLYEEPDGELLEFISNNTNSISVLTRVERENGPVVESPPVDPSSMTVSEVKNALRDDDYDWNDAAIRGLLEAEKNGDDRTTAIDAIEDRL